MYPSSVTPPPVFPDWLTRAFARADVALRDLVVAELSHDRISISTTAWWPLQRSAEARDSEDAVPYAGAFVAPLADPPGGRIELALFEAAATGLEAWLAERDALRASPIHGSPFTAVLLDPHARNTALGERGPSDRVRELADRLVHAWLDALDAPRTSKEKLRQAGPLVWTTKVLDVPSDGTWGARATQLDARLAQLLSEPLGALFFAVPTSFADG